VKGIFKASAYLTSQNRAIAVSKLSDSDWMVSKPICYRDAPES